VVERNEGIVVSWFDALEPQRFARLVSLSIENGGDVADRAHRGFPRLELVLGAPDSSDVLRIRCSGVEGNLEIGNVTGRMFYLVVRDVEAWTWEGIRYSVEAEDVLRFLLPRDVGIRRAGSITADRCA
jgi:hypothetical protein